MDASKSKRVKSIETGGHTVHLGPSGATVYDPVLGAELKRKYKGSDVVIAEKSYVGLKEDGIHSYTFKGVDTNKLKPRKNAGKWVEVGSGRKRYIPSESNSTRSNNNGRY